MYLTKFGTLIINETQHTEFLSHLRKKGTWECNYLNAKLQIVLLPSDTSSDSVLSDHQQKQHRTKGTNYHEKMMLVCGIV